MRQAAFARDRGTTAMALAGAVALTLIILIVTSPGLWFYNDEWSMIRERGLDLDSLLRPHNEHFSAVLVAAYRSMVDLFGTGAYTPYLVVLWLVHFLTAGTVYVLLREDSTTPHQAAAGAILFLLPGVGAHNLFTAFQIGFLLATALGCLALAVSVRRPALAAGLLALAVATQGVGLFYLVATAVRLLGRRSGLWLVLPAAIYLAWFVAYGRSAVEVGGTADLTLVATYALYGIAASFGQGDPRIGAPVIVAVVVGLRDQIGDRLVLAATAGLVSMFVVTGLARADLGVAQAGASRYFTVAFPFVLVIALAAWRSACERYPIRRFGPLIVIVAAALGLSVFATFREWWTPLLAADPLR